MSRSVKKANTFAAYQEDKQARREGLIGGYLIVAKQSRAHFKFVTDLAKFVAVHLTQVEGKECNPATLLRNPRYKSLLLSYLAGEMKPGAKNLVVAPSDSPASKALVTQFQLENRNLASENARLKAHLAELKNDEPNRGVLPSHCAASSTQSGDSNFVLTCQVLLRLLENFGDFVSVDMDSGTLLDLSRKTDNVIADERLAAPFINWLKANRTR